MKKIAFLAGFLAMIWSCGKQGPTYAVIKTDLGEMKVQLYDETPLHRDNFIKLAKEGYYDGLLFHRVIRGFMIQGGDPDSRDAVPGQPLGNGGPGYTLPAEFGQLHIKGALAAARLADGVNPQKESSGSQFYIVQGQPINKEILDQVQQQLGITYTPEQIQEYLEKGGYPPLDGDYTVFGRVVEGLDVIDKIAAESTSPDNRPVRDIHMTVQIVD
ncbi:MAG: peptidylprolyl isomerase [Phaeodactylibacter sp.]|nr:peptidylprolyl isomerase [Phaeodactylibacter sp.]MCB9302357.1 peptidylprolyl isomerase [Lewinellaceae bacterium]HQU57786.1 peptidylprolyl isomerase [Saprospiraceae bacterium]